MSEWFDDMFYSIHEDPCAALDACLCRINEVTKAAELAEAHLMAGNAIVAMNKVEFGDAPAGGFGDRICAERIDQARGHFDQAHVLLKEAFSDSDHEWWYFYSFRADEALSLGGDYSTARGHALRALEWVRKHIAQNRFITRPEVQALRVLAGIEEAAGNRAKAGQYRYKADKIHAKLSA